MEKKVEHYVDFPKTVLSKDMAATSPTRSRMTTQAGYGAVPPHPPAFPFCVAPSTENAIAGGLRRRCRGARSCPPSVRCVMVGFFALDGLLSSCGTRTSGRERVLVGEAERVFFEERPSASLRA